MPTVSRYEPALPPGQVFRQLGEVLYHGDQYEHAYQAICDAARVLVAGCDHASLMVRQGTTLQTRAATDDVARTIDRMEVEAGTGPAVDAIADEKPHLVPDLGDEAGPWPRLRHEVLASTPVRGMLGFRILHGGRKLAALNLLSDSPHGFTTEGVDQAAILAAFCSVAMRAAAEHQEVETLREGLASNREIGKAIGLLMAHHRIDDDAAFAILRRTSNDLNLKLTTVAEEVVRGHRKQLRD